MPESQNTEWKSKWKDEYLEWICGYANAQGGKIYIGDVAFPNRVQMEACRADAGDEWDGDEIYFVVDELQARFPQMRFEPLSYCSGVLTL